MNIERTTYYLICTLLIHQIACEIANIVYCDCVLAAAAVDWPPLCVDASVVRCFTLKLQIISFVDDILFVKDQFTLYRTIYAANINAPSLYILFVFIFQCWSFSTISMICILCFASDHVKFVERSITSGVHTNPIEIRKKTKDISRHT